MRNYSPRGMPSRFMEGAPDIVRNDLIDIFTVIPAMPLDYEIIFRSNNSGEMAGLDFGQDGSQGQHFFLDRHQMRDYRERNRKNRIAWKDLPEKTQKRILEYLIED